jgi:hypothetical protein
MLQHNCAVFGLSNVECLCGDYIEVGHCSTPSIIPFSACLSLPLPPSSHLLPPLLERSHQLAPTLSQDVVVLDPPWGGPQYSAVAVIDDLPLGDWTLLDLTSSLRGYCDIIAIRLPLNYNIDRLAHHLVTQRPQDPPSPFDTRASSPAGGTQDGDWVALSPAPNRLGRVQSALSDSSLLPPAVPAPAPAALQRHALVPYGAGELERPLPFKIMYDVSQLLVVCFPPRPSSRMAFGLSVLDSVIAAVNDWNVHHGRQHHPSFYDWEKSRWIQLSRWRGCVDVVDSAAGGATATGAGDMAEVDSDVEDDDDNDGEDGNGDGDGDDEDAEGDGNVESGSN